MGGGGGPLSLTAEGGTVLGRPVFNLLTLCTCKTPAYRFLLEEFCLSPEWTLAPYWPVIDQRKLRKPEPMCTQRTSLSYTFSWHTGCETALSFFCFWATLSRAPKWEPLTLRTPGSKLPFFLCFAVFLEEIYISVPIGTGGFIFSFSFPGSNTCVSHHCNTFQSQ